MRIFHEKTPVRAKIHTIGRFLAHVDRDKLLSWYRRIGRRKRTVLVHGEEDVMQHFAQHLDDTEVLMPALGSELAL